MSRDFKIESPFAPAGDQPQAIKELCEGIANGEKNQVLLGVTGSGKTFTMAKIIEQSKRPALIMAPNKILAAQLYSEMKEFFPENHVEYFVSYYDYYQPEAYVPKTDTYIERIRPLTNRLTACATPPRAIFWKTTTSSSSHRFPAFMAWATLSPIRK